MLSSDNFWLSDGCFYLPAVWIGGPTLPPPRGSCIYLSPRDRGLCSRARQPSVPRTCGGVCQSCDLCLDRIARRALALGAERWDDRSGVAQCHSSGDGNFRARGMAPDRARLWKPRGSQGVALADEVLRIGVAAMTLGVTVASDPLAGWMIRLPCAVVRLARTFCSRRLDVQGGSPASGCSFRSCLRARFSAWKQQRADFDGGHDRGMFVSIDGPTLSVAFRAGLARDLWRERLWLAIHPLTKLVVGRALMRGSSRCASILNCPPRFGAASGALARRRTSGRLYGCCARIPAEREREPGRPAIRGTNRYLSGRF